MKLLPIARVLIIRVRSLWAGSALSHAVRDARTSGKEQSNLAKRRLRKGRQESKFPSHGFAARCSNWQASCRVNPTRTIVNAGYLCPSLWVNPNTWVTLSALVNRDWQGLRWITSWWASLHTRLHSTRIHVYSAKGNAQLRNYQKNKLPIWRVGSL